jgi:hypothetical protein
LTIGITTLQRVKGAVWQVEGDVFELHVCQPSPRAAGREMLMPASVSLVWTNATCCCGKTLDKIE